MKSKTLLSLALLFVAANFTVLAQEETVVCIPQVVDGSFGPYRWRTTIIVQNQEMEQAQVQMRFLNFNGENMGQFKLQGQAGKGPNYQAGPNGQFDPDPVRNRSMVSFRSRGEDALQIGYCLVQSQSQIRVHARLQMFDLQENLLAETNVTPSGDFTSGSFFLDESEDQDTAIALTNRADDPNVCTFEVFLEGETEPLGSEEIELGPHSQISRYLFELFPELLTDEAGYVRITCEEPTCALVLNLRGLQMLQIPIFVETIAATP